jgi:hypothetical protein
MDAKDEARLVPDKAVEIAPGLWLRRVMLAKGKYAFVTQTYSGDYGHPIAEPVYLFEIK